MWSPNILSEKLYRRIVCPKSLKKSNSADPDQTTTVAGLTTTLTTTPGVHIVLSGSALFAKAYQSDIIGKLIIHARGLKCHPGHPGHFTVIWATTSENRSSGIPTRSDTSRAGQSLKIARDLKFRIWEVEGWYYPRSENKDADQLRGYCEADLRLCFRICKNPVFSSRGSFDGGYLNMYRIYRQILNLLLAILQILVKIAYFWWKFVAHFLQSSAYWGRVHMYD